MHSQKLVNTVLGPVSYDVLGITDAHNHVWIDSIPGPDPSVPVLDQFDLILNELSSYARFGGGSILDCQPGGCGRNGKVLIRLSKTSKVHLIASTGFHRKKYYKPDHWLFQATEDDATRYFVNEITTGLEETLDTSEPALAGFIKIALEEKWSDTPQTLLLAAANAIHLTNSMVEINTEKGALAERAVIFFESQGVPPSRLVLCHMDNRPDFVLHSELAHYGVLLEYDTFFRPKYDPEKNLWPLIHKMVGAGLGGQVALATDMPDSSLYHAIGKGPGLCALPGQIKTQLFQMGIHKDTIQQLVGCNIARRLTGLN
ncbi:MAG: hypothetical protein MUO40_02950 [Anaerolineaceae bacterium]|nr:hypothetical protein [Anaerolineaceae bacterium]